MSLSQKAKEAIRRAVTEDKAATEIEAAIDASGSGPAADVGALGALAPVGFVDVAAAGPANVALSSDVDARVASLQSKIDAILTALKAAGLML